jgi:hypothetical protein
LSAYGPRNNTTFRQLSDLLTTVHDKGFNDYRADVYQTNWGPLAMAVEYHQVTLERCWLICTTGERGSVTQVEEAKRLIELISLGAVKASSISHSAVDANDVQMVAEAANHIYEALIHAPGWQPEDVIADFTGGTAAMSGGIQIAALTQQYPVQYLRQDLLSAPKTLDEVRQANAFIHVSLRWQFSAINDT